MNTNAYDKKYISCLCQNITNDKVIYYAASAKFIILSEPALRINFINYLKRDGFSKVTTLKGGKRMNDVNTMIRKIMTSMENSIIQLGLNQHLEM